MSSHHFVRDGQEPLLLIEDYETASKCQFFDLLEWSPRVVAINDVVHRLIELNIKVDTLLINNEAIRIEEQDIDVVQLPSQYTIDDILSVLNVPEDHFYVFTHEDEKWISRSLSVKLTLFHNTTKWYPLTHGFSKWYKKDTPIQLRGAVEVMSNLQIKETKGNNFTLQVMEDGLIHLKFSENTTVWLGERL